jgi:hypothetical protein
MTSLETLYTKNVFNELSFLLVTHMTCFDIRFGRYVFLNQVSVLDRFWTDWVHKYLIRFLGPKICKTCSGQNTKSRGNKLSFLTPTQTHISDNRSNSYGHLSTDHMRSSTGC